MKSIKKKKGRNIDWLAIIALGIALLGGVPGIIGAIDYFKRISIKIVFEETRSWACNISSKSSSLNEKPAILLYRLTISGKGTRPFYIREIKIALRKNDGWIYGKQFRPTQKNATDKNGMTEMPIHIRYNKLNDYVDYYIAEWKDFSPGERGLSYGEPTSFSYAAYFEINPIEFAQIQQFQVIITDYLGNEYKEEFERSSLKFIDKYPKIILLQD